MMQLDEQKIVAITPLHGWRIYGDPVRIDGTVLLIICAYGDKPPIPRSRLLNLLTLYHFRTWLHEYTKANSMCISCEKQLAYAAAFLSTQHAKKVDIMLLGYGEIPSLKTFPYFQQILEEKNKSKISDDTYNAILVSWSDPLGLGQEGLEGCLPPAKTYICNGRGRILPLRAIPQLLRWRRFLARTRFFECCIGLLLWPLAATLASVDYLRSIRKG